MGIPMRMILSALFCLLVIAVPLASASWDRDGVPISAMTAIQRVPKIATDGEGGAIVAWYANSSGELDIYAQRINAAGNVLWADGALICTADGIQSHPQIVSDGAGGAIIAWRGSGRYDFDIFAQRVDGSGAILWGGAGVDICTIRGDQKNPVITSDGAGGAIIVWHDNRSGSQSDVYAQRVDASGIVQWPANGVVLCAAKGILAAGAERLAIASDGAGGAIAAWRDTRDDYGDIYAQRVDALGATRWSTNGVGLSEEEGMQVAPAIIPDGAGGAIATWSDHRNGGWDVYAQRVDASGAVQWTAGGVALCAATGYQRIPQIISDEAGGAIVAWYDGRSGNWDIYAQRVDVSGAIQWTTDGVALCTAAGVQEYPTIVSDAAGGAIVTWSDRRSGGYEQYADIYAQRVDPSGAVQWAADGIPLCVADDTQYFPVIVSNGAGGAIVAWEDYRGATPAIYAQFVNKCGGIGVISCDLGDEEARAPEAAYLSQNYPNPHNPLTNIAFGLSAHARVSLRIYDSAGRLVRTIVAGDRAAGDYVETWDGRNMRGEEVASGIYFCRLEAGTFAQTRKMILLR